VCKYLMCVQVFNVQVSKKIYNCIYIMAKVGKMSKMNAIYALFVFLTIVLFLYPGFVKNMYGSILGRLLFLILVLFFAMHNPTLGLLIVLIVIVFSQMYFKEGMTTASGTEYTGDNITNAIDALKAKKASNTSTTSTTTEPTSTTTEPTTTTTEPTTTTTEPTTTTSTSTSTSTAPTTAVPVPASGTNISAHLSPEATDKLKATLDQLQGVIAGAKADRVTNEQTLAAKESFTMMGTSFKTHNPDVSAYSPSASYAAF